MTEANFKVDNRRTLKFWPSPQDYNEALQNPTYTFADPELKAGQPEPDHLGLPRPNTGGFASVYRLHCATGDWAVRCFLNCVHDQQSRYQLISDTLRTTSLPYTLAFEYQNEGIDVSLSWFPLLKMEWVTGDTLERYIENHLTQPEELSRLATSFLEMTIRLREVNIAHGDLQHGNIIVTPDGDLKLVDYDCMFVPSMECTESNELGHPNYQHPLRSAEHFGSFLDNFSSWVIYVSLRSLSIDPSLYRQLAAGNDCLLFRRIDFAEPLQSQAFYVLESHHSEEIRLLAKFMRWQLEQDPRLVSALTANPPEVPMLPTVERPAVKHVILEFDEIPQQQVSVHKDFQLDFGETVCSTESFKGSMAIPMFKLMLCVSSLLCFSPLFVHGLSLQACIVAALAISLFVGFFCGAMSSRWSKTIILTNRRLVELTHCRFYLNSIDEHDERIEFDFDEVRSVSLLTSLWRKPRLHIEMKPGYYFEADIPWGMPSDGSFVSLIGYGRGPSGIKYTTTGFTGARAMFDKFPKELRKED